ncbi:PAAR domain-containing protein [Paraburkholderia bryophila]
MMFAFIREGDTTSHGGTVLPSGAVTIFYGKPISFVGTMVVCPKCKGVFPIVTTRNPRMTFGGKHAAFDGDKTACGATLIASQQTATANIPTGVGMGAKQEVGDPTQTYKGRFQVLDRNGQHVPNKPYSLRTADGGTVSGKTDADGYTQWHEAVAPASLIFGHGGGGED